MPPPTSGARRAAPGWTAREAADAIAWAGIHAPSGEFPVGFKAEAAVLGAQLAPGLTRRIAADVMRRVQLEEAPPAANTSGNLFAPSPSPSRVEGGYRGR